MDELKAKRVVPPIPGLFDTDYPAPDGILLSHAHLDHSGLLHLSLPTVPIYASSGTNKVMLAASVFASQQGLDRDRFREVVSREAFHIGDCRVTPLAVDHSIYGSVAFSIEAEEKIILYSGDFRNHGRKPGMIRDQSCGRSCRRPSRSCCLSWGHNLPTPRTIRRLSRVKNFMRMTLGIFNRRIDGRCEYPAATADCGRR